MRYEEFRIYRGGPGANEMSILKVLSETVSVSRLSETAQVISANVSGLEIGRGCASKGTSAIGSGLEIWQQQKPSIVVTPLLRTHVWPQLQSQQQELEQSLLT